MMQRLLRGFLDVLIRVTLKPVFGAWLPVSWQRLALASTVATTRRTGGVAIVEGEAGNVRGEWIRPATGDGHAAILYLHGGGYCIGSPRTVRPLTTGLAAASGVPVFAPDYRVAPEHPFPAALDDAVAAYRALCGRYDRLLVAGDSAGGGLTVALAVAARDAGLRAPAGLALVSPWVDLACTGRSSVERARRDPMLSAAGVLRWGELYAGGRVADPRCSPLNADLSRLPPVLIQVGTEEILHDDSVRLRERLAARAVPCRLVEYQGLWHDFQLHARVLEASDRAIAELAQFARERLASATSPANAA